MPRSIEEWRSMDFNWRSPAFLRLLILCLSVLLFAFLIFDQSITLSIILLAVIVFQVKSLLDFFDKSTENPKTTVTTSAEETPAPPPPTPSRKEVNEEISRLENANREKDSEYQFYKNIVMHVGIGIIIFKESGKIEIINSAARKLLKVTRAENIRDFSEVSMPLVQAFQRLRTGGRELIQIRIGEDIIQLSVYAIEMTLRGENLKLVSLQNIQRELEEKEMEAWQNLVKVLTHEIMNSVTPISSLASIVEDELKPYLEDQKKIPHDQLCDMQLSLQTISKRSDGLIHFVKEFRSLAHIPKPKIENIVVKSLLEEVTTLHKKELNDKNIQLSMSILPEDLSISADKNMIEQVLINLLKNAIQAFDEDGEKRIELKAFLSDKQRPIISVKDTGTGIEPEALEKIFIPFFTTKKTGSGIGLSLSRQIMRNHQGSLTVRSTVGKGTEFQLRF